MERRSATVLLKEVEYPYNTKQIIFLSLLFSLYRRKQTDGGTGSAENLYPLRTGTHFDIPAIVSFWIY